MASQYLLAYSGVHSFPSIGQHSATAVLKWFTGQSFSYVELVSPDTTRSMVFTISSLVGQPSAILLGSTTAGDPVQYLPKYLLSHSIPLMGQQLQLEPTT